MVDCNYGALAALDSKLSENNGSSQGPLAELEQHLKLERVLSELSAQFIDLPANHVDQGITAGLQVLAEAVDNDCAHLGQIDLRTGGIVITHVWCRPDFSPIAQHILEGSLPWLEARIRNGEISLSTRPSDLPPEASRSAPTWNQLDKSPGCALPRCRGNNWRLRARQLPPPSTMG